MADIVVVTGASRGLGRFCGERLVAEGYGVIGLARTADEAAPFEIRICDVADALSVKRSLEDLRRDTRVYALINAAGVAALNLTMMTPVATVRRIVETNLLGTIFCCQALAPALIRRGGGRIVNFSTIAVPLALKGEAVYVASKAGVEGFSRAFAREVADHGVTVNCIAPGPIDTQLIAKVPRDKIDALVAREIQQRQATPADVFATLRLLLSPDGASITGEVLHVGGV